jgi:hypothetical protein
MLCPSEKTDTPPRIEGNFVLFLIGVRVNRPWLVCQWVPTLGDDLLAQLLQAAIRFFGVTLVRCQQEFLGGDLALFIENLSKGSVESPVVNADAIC